LQQGFLSESVPRGGGALRGTLEQQSQRIRELEQLLVQIAVAAERDWRGKDQALVEQSGTAIAMTTDVVSVWQATPSAPRACWSSS
jgi:hypothetical protein